MAKKANETDEEKAEREAAEATKAAEVAERAKVAEENKTLIDEQRKLAGEAREKAAKAEGMLEAVKALQQTQSKREWSEDEWKEFEEKTGFTKAGMVALDGALGAKIRDVETKFEEKTRQAEERAKLAEGKYEEYERGRTVESQKSSYFRDKPQFSKYEKEIDSFLADYPAETKKDPVKFKSILEKAEIYIRGKVGDKEMRRTPGGSARFGSEEAEGEGEKEEQVDLSELRGHERLTVEKLLTNKEKDEKLRAVRHDLKGEQGIMISAKEDFDNYKKK